MTDRRFAPEEYGRLLAGHAHRELLDALHNPQSEASRTCDELRQRVADLGEFLDDSRTTSNVQQQEFGSHGAGT